MKPIVIKKGTYEVKKSGLMCCWIGPAARG